jgi:hypothetical protein
MKITVLKTLRDCCNLLVMLLQAAAFNWGQARFRVRGLDSEHATMMINGVVMNKIYDGRPAMNGAGLNDDALRTGIHTRTAPGLYIGAGTQEIKQASYL